jgi:YfiH family protein
MINKAVSLNNSQQIFYFDVLTLHKAVAHCITTRNSFNRSDYNLSFHTGQEAEVLQNRRTLQQFFEGTSLTIPKQCHGTQVVQITKDNNHEIPEGTDALVTNVTGLVIGVLSADCVPVLFYDPVKKVLGAAHAGWKGTVGNIVSATLEKMREAYNCKPSNVLAFIGPSIAELNFEVGEEVAERFYNFGLSAVVKKYDDGKSHIDLWLANSLLLERAGVRSNNIYRAEIDTYQRTDSFYSARREGFDTGRFGAFIMLV